MKDTQLAVVILAAGKGTRMKSSLPKVLHKLNNKPLLAYVIDLAKGLEANPIITVVGFAAEQVKSTFAGDTSLTFVLQEPQLGTGHAVMQAAPMLQGFTGSVIILSGDVPGLKSETLLDMLRIHGEQGNALTVLGMRPNDPAAYGRMLVQGDKLQRIVEFRDASMQERAINLVNAGIYLVRAENLLDGLRQIETNNEQQEYYLTDLVDIFNNAGLPVGYALCADPLEVAGVNSQEELRELEKLLLEVN